jgi:hypothetical protein
MGIRGEPSTPKDPSKGLVWVSITDNIDRPGAENDFVSVDNLDRVRLLSHPWSIGGGGAADLKEQLGDVATQTLSDLNVDVGFVAVTREDDVYMVGSRRAQSAGIDAAHIRPLVVGEDVRDWSIQSATAAIWPYSASSLESDSNVKVTRFLWPWRAQLSVRVAFGKTQLQRGLEWSEYSMFFVERFRSPLSITFAAVATHNNFVLDRGGKLFKDSAPVIKLRDGAAVQRYVDLLGLLNSSTACFWIKQVFQGKPSNGVKRGLESEAWTVRYQIDATKLPSFPLPPTMPGELAAELDRSANDLAALSAVRVVATSVPTGEDLREARKRYRTAYRRMVGLQEQLDWDVYLRYGLIDERLTLPEGEPPLDLGQRAFEIVLARKMMAGELSTAWFDRHRSTPITELPSGWSPEYRRVVERRIELIESDKNIGLIERPEYKRRWNTTSWETQQVEALRGWLLDRLESPEYWPSPLITTVARLAAHARTDADFMSVARLYVGRDDVDVAVLIGELVKGEAVPYLAALRYKPSGMRKWEQWCETWELQRREDAGEDVGEILLPPKYTSADFLPGVWTHRGKLDVPKERFISYSGAESETDTSLVVGWAGWDHLDRARALATLYLQAKREGRAVDHLTPMLAGLAELVPWLLQWYDDPNPDPALDRPGSQIRALVDSELRSLHLTPDDFTAWRPPATTKRRSKKTT